MKIILTAIDGKNMRKEFDSIEDMTKYVCSFLKKMW